MVGGVALPITPEARETAYRRLVAEGVLVDRTIADQRRCRSLRFAHVSRLGDRAWAYENPGARTA
jgi:hypothetical protein